MTNFEEQMKLLVELQGIDGQIYRLEGELAEIPEKIGQIDAAYEAKTANLKALEEGVKGLVVKRKEKEGALADKEGTIKKYQSQLGQVKTNKEYSALQDEINRIKADDSLIEEDILGIFDQVDAENKKIAAEKESLKAEEATAGAAKKALNEEAARIKSELESLKGRRDALAPQVEKMTLARYEKILKGKDGLAVVSIAGDACGGCYRMLPPQVINEVRLRKGIITCEYCARILYTGE